MSEKIFMKGNEAIAEAAIRGGLQCYFGYPITPQSEIPEYISANIAKTNGVFLQAESEVAAINMVFGAGGAGSRAMTSSSSPGVSLMQEGISYIACAEIPCVIINMVRSGPGLGGIQPAQGDYFQSVKGGGHGDYKMLVYGPASVQEAVDITYDAFDKAFKYRMPVMILGDGLLAQIMEAIELPEFKDFSKEKSPEWATDGKGYDENRRIINSLYIEPEELEEVIHRLFDKYEVLKKEETRWEEYKCDDAEIIIAAYGSVGRIAKGAVDALREKGHKVGLFRPISLFPFPSDAIKALAEKDSVKTILTVEMSMGQMVEDIKLSVEGKKPVKFFSRVGGFVMSAEEIVDEVLRIGGSN